MAKHILMVVALVLSTFISGSNIHAKVVLSSNESLSLSKEASKLLASDIVSFLEEKFEPAKTTFNVIGLSSKKDSNSISIKPSRNGNFGSALKNALRRKGYALSTKGDKKIDIKYSIDKAEDILVILDLGQKYIQGFVFEANSYERLGHNIISNGIENLSQIYEKNFCGYDPSKTKR